MPTSPIPYDIFTTSNGALVNEGGPWYYDSSNLDVNIGSQNGTRISWCSDVPWCITAWMYPSVSLSFYSVSFFTNISVDLNLYPNSNSLQCYKPLWISTKSVEGTLIPMKSTIGTSSFNDSISAGNYDLVFTTGDWEGPTITHDAEVPLTRNRGITTAYISIYINITYPRQPDDYINYYVKSATFKINTPGLRGATTSGLAAGASTSGAGSALEPKKDRTALIVAVVMGVLFLFTLIVLGLLCVKHKRGSKRKNTIMWKTVDLAEQIQTISLDNVTPFVSASTSTHQGTESTSAPASFPTTFPDTEFTYPSPWNIILQTPPSTRAPTARKRTELPAYGE